MLFSCLIMLECSLLLCFPLDVFLCEGVAVCSRIVSTELEHTALKYGLLLFCT